MVLPDHLVVGVGRRADRRVGRRLGRQADRRVGRRPDELVPNHLAVRERVGETVLGVGVQTFQRKQEEEPMTVKGRVQKQSGGRRWSYSGMSWRGRGEQPIGGQRKKRLLHWRSGSVVTAAEPEEER